MATTSDLLEETTRYLLSSQREPLNKLHTDILSTDTTLTFEQELKGIQAGGWLSAGLETMYVWSVNPTGKSAVVERGQQGSTAAAHLAGTIFTVNPKFPAASILSAINAELDGLAIQGIYGINTMTFTFNPAVMTYDIAGASSIIDIIKVESQVPGPSRLWPLLRSFRLHRNANPSEFPSGFALTLYSGAYPGRTVRVTYSTGLNRLANLTDDVVGVTGIQASSVDIPPLGAALRLSGFRETSRNFFETQGDTRRATEVPVNAQNAGMQSYARIYANRIKIEANNLLSSYPIKRRLPTSA